MKNFLKYTQTILSVIAITLSIIAICVTYPRRTDSSLDYFGIIVGILGILVAILVGWQLYNALNLKELVTQTENAKHDAIDASKQANEMLSTTQTLSNDISHRVTNISAKVDSLSDYTSKNMEHLTGLSQNVSSLQEIVQKSMELFSELQTKIRDLGEELDHKWDKSELQAMSETDINDIFNGIIPNDKPDDPTLK